MAIDIFNPKHEFLAGLVFAIFAILTEQLVLFLHTIEDKGFWVMCMIYMIIGVLWLLTFSFIFSAILCFIHAYVDLKNPEPKTTQQ